MVTTAVPHEIGDVSSLDEDRRSYAQHVNPIPLMVAEAQLIDCVESVRSAVETVHSSKVFWVDALNLGRRAMSL
jgi:hypothetical protein